MANSALTHYGEILLGTVMGRFRGSQRQSTLNMSKFVNPVLFLAAIRIQQVPGDQARGLFRIGLWL